MGLRRLGGMVVAVAAVAAACVSGPQVQRHPLPRLTGVDSVELPAGFEGYDDPTAPYASTHPIHVDSAFFAMGASHDLGGNRRCRAQITVSPFDPAIATPAGYVELLGTKLCDSAWFATQWDENWRRPDASDPHLWALDFSTTRYGWFGGNAEADVAGVLFVPERRVVVGLWARQSGYPPDRVAGLLRQVAASIR